jgi:hypothetical protein
MSIKWVKKDKKDGYLDFAVKSKKDVPAANAYLGCSDWKKELDSLLYGGSPNKGKFLKSKRRTQEAEILENKKELKPGPGTYDPKYLEKHGLPKSKEERG